MHAASATPPENWVWKGYLPRRTRAFSSFGARTTRWLLRKAVFRQDGAPHTMLLLADVSLPLQEGGTYRWKRLIRVLGHELSNSLTPIKSIAGSLLARVDAIDGDDTTVRDFRRGLGVVESRAGAAPFCPVLPATGPVASAAAQAGLHWAAAGAGRATGAAAGGSTRSRSARYS